MFRNDQQISMCAMILTASIPGRWWELDGPAKAACSADKVGVLSSGERVLLDVAFAIWNGWGAGGRKKGLPIAYLFKLDGTNLKLVASLFTAIAEGSFSIDRWILDNWPRVERYHRDAQPCPLKVIS